MTPAKPARNPRLPGTVSDRTGTAGILRRANAAIRARFAGLQKDVLAIFDRIRVLAVNEDFGRVVYAMTPQEMAATSQALQDALERWIISGRETADVFWWSGYVAEASQLGTAQSVTNLTAISTTYAGARTLQQVLFSQPYVTRVGLAQVKSYDHWTGLSAGMRSELSQIIGRAVADGKNPRAVRSEIAERLDVSKARALGYAQSDITDTLRLARLAEDEAAEAQFNIRTGELWTSALLPTTRPSHSARHGKVYTREEVRAFYSVNGNRYRCHCSITACLLDENGKPILTDRLKADMAKEVATWKAKQPAK
jgi:hypothetical protein